MFVIDESQAAFHSNMVLPLTQKILVEFLGCDEDVMELLFTHPRDIDVESRANTPVKTLLGSRRRRDANTPVSRFPCLHADCTKQFYCAAELDRHHFDQHQKMVHCNEKGKANICDYRKCLRHRTHFHRTDHSRDHIRGKDELRGHIRVFHQENTHLAENNHAAHLRRTHLDFGHTDDLAAVDIPRQEVSNHLRI